jgi:hypothetical protein
VGETRCAGDHVRDLDFALSEVKTIRITEHQFRSDAEGTVTKVASLLSRRQVRWI